MFDLRGTLEKYINHKIALYGLGVETEKALKELSDFDIVGLLDGFQEEGNLYGKEIISLDECLTRGVKLIIVVARPGSCKAIAKRVGEFCIEHGIALMDIRGKDLLAKNAISYDFSRVNGIQKKDIYMQIEKADVVSFDFFDTLAMRQVLLPTDVIELVNGRLREADIFIEGFCSKRLQSEKELSKHTAPSLLEIYEDVVKKCNITCITAKQLAELEWQIDYELVIPRREMCEIFKRAYRSGKLVYIVSDTYYSKEQMQQLAEKCGIQEYTDILSSSECGTSKTQHLYQVLKERANGKKYLHMGDDLVADIDSASMFGIDTCKIDSAMDLLECLGNLGLENFMDSLSERIQIGMFIANLFNSPFQFETENRKMTVNDAYDIGYLFCAPMISDFVIWFQKQMKNERIQNVWFTARDGYLIQKMYTELDRSAASEYFLTSRIAAIRAGMCSLEDVQYVNAMKFSGSVEECLRERFGILENEIKQSDILEKEDGLLKYRAPIMRESEKEREHYQTYLKKLAIKDGEIAFFDFVAKGTCQFYVQKLVKNHIKGFYFLQLEAEQMEELGVEIVPFYSKEETQTSAIYESYYILETLLTAPHPSVVGFDEKGEPIYARETRHTQDIECFQRAQDGILDYFKRYLLLCPKSERKENKKLDEVLLTLIHQIRIEDQDFLNLVVEDPFFNRRTNITDVI